MRTLLLLCILVFMGVTAQAVFAQETGLTYTPVVQIPGLDANTQDTQQYVNALYMLAVSIAALLAVVKIIFGGVKWMLSDIVTDKASAKKDIQGAIFGLLIVLGTVLILNTINPNLTRLNFLENATPLNVTLSGMQTKTACEINADSEACCIQKGGTFIASESRCSLGQNVPLPSDVSGDDTQSRILCEQTHGGTYVGGECRITSGREIPITGVENSDENDIAYRCQVLGGNYDRQARKCYQL